VPADDAEGSGRTTLFGERRAAGLAPLYIETALGVNSFGGQGDRPPLDFGVIESEAGDLFEDFGIGERGIRFGETGAHLGGGGIAFEASGVRSMQVSKRSRTFSPFFFVNVLGTSARIWILNFMMAPDYGQKVRGQRLSSLALLAAELLGVAMAGVGKRV
jgi:hypothetical protein